MDVARKLCLFIVIFWHLTWLCKPAIYHACDINVVQQLWEEQIICKRELLKETTTVVSYTHTIVQPLIWLGEFERLKITDTSK